MFNKVSTFLSSLYLQLQQSDQAAGLPPSQIGDLRLQKGQFNAQHPFLGELPHKELFSQLNAGKEE